MERYTKKKTKKDNKPKTNKPIDLVLTKSLNLRNVSRLVFQLTLPTIPKAHKSQVFCNVLNISSH